MSATTERPPAPRTGVASVWIGLIGGTFVGFILGALLQIGLMLLLGKLDSQMCITSTGCSPGQHAPNGWQTILLTVPSYLAWAAPSVWFTARGRQLTRGGVRGGKVILVTGILLVIAITVFCAAIWWIPGL